MAHPCPTCGKVMATAGGLDLHLDRAHRGPGPGAPPPAGPPGLPPALAVANRVGTTLVLTGLFLFLFAAYQLWGTDLVTRWHQRGLKGDVPAAARAVTARSALPAPEGGSVAVLWIPRIGLEVAVVEGVGVADLKRGPGHYPGTPLPGSAGNAAIAGHRTTYGAPFSRLDELAPGDPVLVSTRVGTARYEVAGSQVVHPSRSEVLAPMGDDRLTLTTCHPRFSAAQRLVVVARLVTPAAPPAPPPTVTEAAPARTRAGLSGDAAGAGPTVAYGGAAAAGLVATRLWARRRRSRRPWVVAAPGLALLLLLFFENFDRLLPGNI